EYFPPFRSEAPMARKVATSALVCGIALAASLRLVAPAAAQDARAQCFAEDGVSASLRVIACSVVIELENAPPIDRARAFANRGYGYSADGSYDDAIADYDAAIALDPDDATFYSARASAYGYKQDYEHAFADYDSAIRLDPKLARAFLGRGVAYQ